MKYSDDELAEYLNEKRSKISQAVKALTADLNNPEKTEAAADELRRISAGLGTYVALLDRMNDGPVETRSPKLVAIAQSFQDLRDDIATASRGELPGQEPPALPGDEWKDAE